jgi:hypothetical protein
MNMKEEVCATGNRLVLLYQASWIAYFCLGLVALSCGCRTNESVKFGNGTASKVWVQSLRSGQKYEIAIGCFKKVSHASRDFVVTTETNQRFKFADISPYHVDPEYCRKGGNLFGFSYAIIAVRLETNMQVYAVMPDKKTIDENVEQPKGYPKTGERLE